MESNIKRMKGKPISSSLSSIKYRINSSVLMRSHCCRRLEGVLKALQLCCSALGWSCPTGVGAARNGPSASCCVLCSIPLRPTSMFWVHSWTGGALGLTLILDEDCWFCKLVSSLSWFELGIMTTWDGVFSCRLFVIGEKDHGEEWVSGVETAVSSGCDGLG